jgi:hypothetical protein
MKTQDTTKLTSLERICYGNNKINALSIEALKKVLPQIQSFIGKKIKLVTNDKAKIFKIELLDVPYSSLDGASYRSYLSFFGTSLYLKHDVTVKDKNYEGGGHGVSYYKKELYIGKLNDEGILVSVDDIETVIKGYKLDVLFDSKVIEATKKKIEQLENEIRELKNQLPTLLR